jgi:hypothetical protein
MARYQIYEKYRKYVRERDDRPMDEICSADGEFALQVQQNFLKDYIRENPAWDKLLLYHQIGSGKTCTAITIAETFMEANPDYKTTVVLPARLRTNFFDELVSPCGMDAYVSRADFVLYQSSDTSAAAKRRIRGRFMEAIKRKYDILSFEQYRIAAHKAHDLTTWVREFTKNRLIVIDEVHNLFNSTYNSKAYKEVVEEGTLKKKMDGINAVLMRYMCEHADPSCKMIFLTATPIFDNIVQFRELARAVNPGAVAYEDVKTLSAMIEYVRGRVSFFPGTSANAYPAVEYAVHAVPITETQDELTEEIQRKLEDEDEDKEAFMSDQRQVSITCFPDEPEKVVKNLAEYAPKVALLMDTIADGVGKHVVYSSFVKTGVTVTRMALEARGWVNLADVVNKPDAWSKAHYKVYAIWDGTTKDADKQLIKGIANRRDNMDGRYLRVIMGSPSIKEGISFKHIQHLHLLDPVWNQSAKTQVEGRAIRFCSHTDIPVDHPTLAKKVVVHIYKLVHDERGLVAETCDEVIYDKIIPRKYKVIEAAEKALKKVAIDHYLFRNMYATARHRSPVKKSGKSSISIEEDFKIRKQQPGKPKCKKGKDVDEDGNCPDGYEAKPLAANPAVKCCYKMPAKKAAKKADDGADGEGAKATKGAAKCPKGRTPINGECADGYYTKVNKKGVECCFKRRVVKK